MVANVTTENPDRRAPQIGRQIAQMGHLGFAFFTNARRDVRGSGIGRRVRVSRRHRGNSFTKIRQAKINFDIKWVDAPAWKSGVLAKLVRDRIAARGFVDRRFVNTGLEGTFRRQPRLGHGALDNVPLNPFAFRARKRSQILAGAARLNGRELH